ncbi:DUF1003 domain-containing protein [Brevundimonas sp.]|uniref:DUF1003 domain-containing protein n=1 Tax=Brevundimonas sp. TaxID=1871086 RepID=UPI0035B0DC16
MTRDGVREELSRGLLGLGYAELTPVQRSVVDLMAAETPTGHGPALVDDRSGWERLADRVAQVGGSWTFLGAFALAMAAWVGTNLLLARWAFDPYPFIFLNLVLSTLAAVQAPVILMSQNRQAARDRQAAEHDYRVNLRAELEIMRLHDRLQLSEAQLQRIEAALAALGPATPGSHADEASRT